MIDFASYDTIIPMPQKSNEWYTPARYVEAAREVMGSIDLDPASCKEANMVVKATHYYTERENGLEQPWHGNVWCNPPYGRVQSKTSRQLLWFTKLLQEYKQGNIQQALFLTTSDTDEKWFRLLWDYPICFTDHYIYFNRPHQKHVKQFFGSCFTYMGDSEQRFIDIFSEFGTVARRVSTPKARPVTLSLWGDA
jgi:hypothetical protein